VKLPAPPPEIPDFCPLTNDHYHIVHAHKAGESRILPGERVGRFPAFGKIPPFSDRGTGKKFLGERTQCSNSQGSFQQITRLDSGRSYLKERLVDHFLDPGYCQKPMGDYLTEVYRIRYLRFRIPVESLPPLSIGS